MSIGNGFLRDESGIEIYATMEVYISSLKQAI